MGVSEARAQLRAIDKLMAEIRGAVSPFKKAEIAEAALVLLVGVVGALVTVVERLVDQNGGGGDGQ